MCKKEQKYLSKIWNEFQAEELRTQYNRTLPSRKEATVHKYDPQNV